MKFTILPSNLLDALNRVTPAVGKTDITSLVKIESSTDKVNLCCTDTSIALETNITTDVAETGGVCVSAKTLVDVLKKLDSDKPVVIQTIEKDRICISSGRFKNRLCYIETEYYPAIEQFKNLNSVTFNTKELFDIINSVKFCVSQDSYRAFLKGANFVVEQDKIQIMGANGHLLSYAKTSGGVTFDEPQSFIIPKHSLDVISGILKSVKDETVIMRISTNSISIETEDVKFLSILIDAKYPDIGGMLNFTPNIKLLIERDTIIRAIRRVAITANNLNKAITFRLNNNELSLSSVNSSHENAEDTITCERVESTVNDFEIAFSSEYMLNILGAIDTDFVWFVGSTGNNNFKFTECLDSKEHCKSDTHSIDEGQALYLLSRVVV